MNYYNPYYYTMPINMGINTEKTGIFSRLFGNGFTFGKFIDGTQKVLNLANQAIPLVKQVKPIIGNAKTMFKVMNEFKRVENKTNIITQSNESTNLNNSGPTFFV